MNKKNKKIFWWVLAILIIIALVYLAIRFNFFSVLQEALASDPIQPTTDGGYGGGIWHY